MSRELMQKALEDICGAKLCEINSMSSRAEMLRLLDKAELTLRKALERPAQPEPVMVAVEKLLGHISDVLDDYGFEKIDAEIWNSVSSLVGLGRSYAAPQPTQQPQQEPSKQFHDWAVAEHQKQREALERPEQEPVAWEHHAKRLTHWLHCMSYNDSYFGEPAGLVKQVTAELNRLIGANTTRSMYANR